MFKYNIFLIALFLSTQANAVLTEQQRTWFKNKCHSYLYQLEADYNSSKKRDLGCAVDLINGGFRGDMVNPRCILMKVGKKNKEIIEYKMSDEEAKIKLDTAKYWCRHQ